MRNEKCIQNWETFFSLNLLLIPVQKNACEENTNLRQRLVTSLLFLLESKKNEDDQLPWLKLHPLKTCYFVT